MKNKNVVRKVVKICLGVLSLVGLFYIGSVFASAPAGIAVSGIAKTIDKSVAGFATILSDISLIAGIGFVMVSFFKFHQHRNQPTQVPVTNGIALLLIGAAMCLFPTLLPTAKNAVFGDTATIATIGGSGIHSIIGSGNT